MLHRVILKDYNDNEIFITTKYYPTVSWHRWLDKRRFFITDYNNDHKHVFEGSRFKSFLIEVINESTIAV